jgi:hypothetical protein
VDALTALVCLAVGIAIPLVAMFLLVRRGWRQLAVARSYGEVSRRLGLDVDTRGVALHGHLGEQRIWVGQVMIGHGTERRMAWWGVLDLERPLGLGFLLRRRGLRERLRRWRGPKLPLDERLGRRIELHGDDAERVRQLLTDPVRALLRTMLERWRDLVITDTSVRVMLRSPPARTGELHDLVDAMRALAAELVRARRAMTPPPALASRSPEWEQLATELGVAFEPEFPGVAGTLHGRPLRITPIRTEEGYRAELRLGFHPHRRTGVQVREQKGPDGYWSVGQDIQFGDPDFDGAFVVKGYDPEQVRELLLPLARERLVALTTIGRVDVDDLRLHVGGLPVDARRLALVVRDASAAADALGW